MRVTDVVVEGKARVGVARDRAGAQRVVVVSGLVGALPGVLAPGLDEPIGDEHGRDGGALQRKAAVGRARLLHAIAAAWARRRAYSCTA